LVRWHLLTCDRSANSYQAQAALQLEQRDPRTSVTFVHLACSGGSIRTGMLGNYNGMYGGPPIIAPQGEPMRAAAGRREIDAVLPPIAVNDLQFGDLVSHCIKTAACPDSKFPDSSSPKTLAEVTKDNLKKLVAGYRDLAKALAKIVPADRVYITEYF